MLSLIAVERGEYGGHEVGWSQVRRASMRPCNGSNLLQRNNILIQMFYVHMH